MSKTHRKHAREMPPSPPKPPSRKQRMQQALAQQEQESRGAVEFPQPEVTPPRPDW